MMYQTYTKNLDAIVRFGDRGVISRIDETIDNLIEPMINQAGAYDLVLDMNYQIYGRVPNVPHADLPPEDITITATNVGGNLQLSIEGPDALLNGIYYSAPANNIKSLTIRGSGDNETIVINGPLGFGGAGATKALTIDGRGGKDIVKIVGLDRPGDFYGPVNINGGAASEGNELFFDDTSSSTNNTYDVTGSHVTRRGLTQMNYANFSKLDVKGGTGQDIFHALNIPQPLKLGLAAGPTADDKLYVESGFLDDPTLTNFEHLFLSGGTLKLVTNSLTLTTFTQTGGTLDGAANVTVSKVMSWSGGTMQGTGRTEALDGSVATIAGPVTLTARRFVNAGAGTWAGAIGGGGGTLENAWSGTLNATGTLAGDLENSGLLRPGGAGSVGRVTVGGRFSHSGTLAVDLGPEGDASDQVVAQTVTLSGTISPAAVSGSPAKFYTVVVDQSAGGGGAFANAAHGAVLTVGGARYKMLYEADPTYWGRAVLRAVADIGDYAWQDGNMNGRQGELVPAEVTVKLHKAETAEVVATTSSGPDGKYRFRDVLVGNYYLVFTPSNSDWWRFTLANAGVDDADDSDADRVGGFTPAFTLVPGVDNLIQNAGLYLLGKVG